MFIKWKVPVFFKQNGISKRKSGKTNYGEYHMTVSEEVRCLIEGMGMMCLFAYFFYRSIWAIVFLSPVMIWYRKEKKKRLSKKRREIIEVQFKEVLLSINTSLQAGYSIENAFLESYHDVVRLFGKDGDMAQELIIIQRGLSNGMQLEQLLWDFGIRCPDSEIAEFAEVFSVARRTGGKWNEVMKKTSGLIQEKIEMKEEIETMIHARKLESRMMCVIPFFILFYVDMTSKGFFDVLYHNLAGVVIMTLCLGAYGFAFYWSEKITEISL